MNDTNTDGMERLYYVVNKKTGLAESEPVPYEKAKEIRKEKIDKFVERGEPRPFDLKLRSLHTGMERDDTSTTGDK